MIRIFVGGGDLTDLRITVSPLWEVFGSLSSLILGRTAAWPYSEWCRATERALMYRPGAELLAWFRHLPGPVPSCLTPVPDEAEHGLEEELARLLDALPGAPPHELAQLAVGSRGQNGRRPAAWAEWFSTTMLDYWQIAIAPHWTSMRTALHDEVHTRAHMLATKGSSRVLSDLGSRARWSPPVLELPGCLPSRDLRCTDRLVAIPLIFGRRTTRCVSDGAGTVAVSFQARGAAVLARSQPAVRRDRSQPSQGDRLALLLGRGRAAVVRGLAVPSTTSELADSLGMSASTVSQHLGTLLAADVVHKRRMGVRVVYTLNPAGVALLEHFNGEAQRPGVRPATGPAACGEP